MFKITASVIAIAAAVASHGAAFAQTDDAPLGTGEDGDEAIIVTGSRFGGRSNATSISPVDSISRDALTGTGSTQLQDMLKLTVPAFNTPRPATAGVTDFLTPPTLRGLSTGQLLLLVNGKRRHLSASLNLNQQIGRGDVAYDFNAIPSLALSRAEVLRDGASAQYGSDAIAGVINLMLDERVGFDANAGYSMTTRGDGETWTASAGAGFALGDGGFIRVTGEYQNQKLTDRALPDTRQQYFGTNGSGAAVAPSGNYGSGTGLTPGSGTLDPREATIDRNMWVYGQPPYEAKKLFANAMLPVAGDAAELYAFGGYSHLEGTSYQFFRRAGQDETVRSIFPDGFVPEQRLQLENWSASAGLRGDLGGFGYDLSSTFGNSLERYFLGNTNNASLGGTSPTSFYRGAYRFRQWTNNLDLTRSLDVGDGAPLNIAIGAEYRKEYFVTFAGEPDSYRNGGVAIIGGPNNGRPAPVGGQPSPGYLPTDAGHVSRNSKAVYGEISKQFMNRLTLDGAARYEDFSDFGDTWNWKVGARLEIVSGLALRGSYNTGFRAPTLQQQYTATTNTQFVSGQPTTIRVVSTRDRIAPLIGAVPLAPEKSKNLSLGVVFSPPSSGLTLSADYYNIRIDNRIAISSNFSSTALTNLLAANGAPSVQTVGFLTNAVDTTTQGVDLSATWRTPLAGGTLNLILGGTMSETKFRRIAGTPPALAALGISTVLFDLTQQVRLTDSIPQDKATFSLNWEGKRFGFRIVNSYYGEVSQVALTGRTAAQVAALVPGYDVEVRPANAAGTSFDIIQNFGAEIVTDIEAHYKLTRSVTLSVGADNLFDNMPARQIASTPASVAAGTNGADNNGTFPYAYIAPFGVNGTTIYGRIRFSL